VNGKLERSGDGWALRFERTFPHPPEKLWRAITEPEHLAAWFPDSIVVSEWKGGAPLRFEHPGGGFDGEVCLDQLEAHLAGASGPPVSDTWHAVHPHYVESFGPEAATIGPPEDAP
jgi:hypothetical protein